MVKYGACKLPMIFVITILVVDGQTLYSFVAFACSSSSFSFISNIISNSLKDLCCFVLLSGRNSSPLCEGNLFEAEDSSFNTGDLGFSYIYM